MTQSVVYGNDDLEIDSYVSSFSGLVSSEFGKVFQKARMFVKVTIGFLLALLRLFLLHFHTQTNIGKNSPIRRNYFIGWIIELHCFDTST